jgi:FkbM family methyltransferase
MTRRSLFKRIGRRLEREAATLRLFGGGALIKHHLRLLGSRGEYTTDLADVGPVNLRSVGDDLASFRNIFAERQYEIPIGSVRDATTAHYEAILAAGRIPVVVDAGAFIGAASLWFHCRFPQAHVVALEPQPDNFSLLERNLAGRRCFTAIQAAVGSAPGHVELADSGDLWGTQTHRSPDGVAVMTMNEAFAQIPEGEPFLAKVNIEGFERDLFSDGLDWLDRIAVLFIEPHDWLFPGRHTSRTFQKALGDRDFQLFFVGPHLCYVRL